MLGLLFVSLVLVAVALSLHNWRLGLLLLVVIGGLQDPVRKLTPGAPAGFVLSGFPVWVAACLALFGSSRHPFREIQEDHPVLWRAILVFSLCLVPGAVLVLQYGPGAWRLSLVGLFGYLMPISAFVMGFHYVRSEADLTRLIRVYAVVTSILLLGTLFEHLGLFSTWSAIGTESMKMRWIRYRQNYVVHLIAGFYRSPDIMGWHAAMLVMLALTMAIVRGPVRGSPFIALAVWGGLCVLLGGRRKSIMMPVIWGLVVALTFIRGGGAAKLFKFGTIAAVLVAGIVFASREAAMDAEYLQYAGTDPREIRDRVQQHSLSALRETYRQSGFFGKGLGTASLGIQHLGLGVRQSWQEGGLPRFLVELGVPGLLAGLFLGAMLLRECVGAVGRCASGSPGAPLVAGLFGIIVANVCSFVTSHQLFNDLVIMVLTGSLWGIVISGPKWCDIDPDEDPAAPDADHSSLPIVPAPGDG